MARSRQRLTDNERPSVPPKDAPPGYAIRFDRWTTRRWYWREEKTGLKSEPYKSRSEAVHAVYERIRLEKNPGHDQ